MRGGQRPLEQGGAASALHSKRQRQARAAKGGWGGAISRERARAERVRPHSRCVRALKHAPRLPEQARGEAWGVVCVCGREKLPSVVGDTNDRRLVPWPSFKSCEKREKGARACRGGSAGGGAHEAVGGGRRLEKGKEQASVECLWLRLLNAEQEGEKGVGGRLLLRGRPPQ